MVESVAGTAKKKVRARLAACLVDRTPSDRDVHGESMIPNLLTGRTHAHMHASKIERDAPAFLKTGTAQAM